MPPEGWTEADHVRHLERRLSHLERQFRMLLTGFAFDGKAPPICVNSACGFAMYGLMPHVAEQPNQCPWLTHDDPLAVHSDPAG